MGFYTPNSLVQDAQHHGVVVQSPDVNLSWFDCTVEPLEADERDLADYLGMKWRRGRGALSDPIRPAVALRLGLRYVRNLGDAEITRIEAARMVGGPFQSPEDLAQRTGLALDAYEALAASGALSGFGIGRREGIWAILVPWVAWDRTVWPSQRGRLLRNYLEMTLVETMQADLWSTGIATTHPVSFLRVALAERGCLTTAEALAVSQTRQANEGGRDHHAQAAPGNGKRCPVPQSRGRDWIVERGGDATGLGKPTSTSPAKRLGW